MKKIGISLLLILIIFYSGCKSTQVNKQEITTHVEINNTKIYLDMPMEDIQLHMQDDALKRNSWKRGIVCSNMNHAYMFSNEKEINQVLEQNAYVWYYVNEENTLAETEIIWMTEYNQEALFEKLVETYGSNYEKTWIKYYYVFETYKWDMEDGVTILWMPEREPGYGNILLMVYTDELTAEVDGPEGEPVSVSSNN